MKERRGRESAQPTSAEAEQYWLWLGPVATARQLLTKEAVSLAANRWQAGLLGALERLGQGVRIVSYLPEPLWPKGVLRIGGKELGRECSRVQGVSYWNAPGVRERTLAAGHLRVGKDLLGRYGRPEVVLSYNAPEAYQPLLKRLRESERIPWIPVILDSGVDAAGDVDLERRLAGAAGRVYLSWGSVEGWVGDPPRLHLDGGVSTRQEMSAGEGRQAVLYSGALSEYGGVDRLAEAFGRMKSAAVELWICGKGTRAKREGLTAMDPRITVFGVVSEAELEMLTQRAAVLVNPRPPELYATLHTFPSKVLEYLAYGKPVVSTWSPVFSEDYRRVLLAPKDASVEALAACLEEALEMSDARRDTLRCEIRRFAECHTWEAQAGRLIHWVRTRVIGSSRGRSSPA